MKKKLLKKNCQTCQKEIQKKYYHSPKNWKKVKFCCLKCFRHTKENRLKLKEQSKITGYQKGHISWHKGKIGVYSKETLGKMRLAKIGKTPSNWKGDDVLYGTLHDWVNYHLGKANYCFFNKNHVANRYHWANKSHEYKRDLKDWISLCVKCHSKYDKKS